jgi:peptidoglycan/xylan/chitin deacetylase (PgdA/CDA1 family)
MRYLFKIFSIIISKIWIIKNKIVSQDGLRILIYHSVGSKIPDDIQGRYSISGASLRSQIQYLKQSGYKLVSLRESIPGSGIAISFDDGYKDNFEIAYPILSELSIPFTIFISTDNLFSNSQLFLNAEDVRKLSRDPLVTIGSHGTSHRALSKLFQNELEAELSESKKILEELTGREVNGISYPHGCYDDKVIKAVKVAGYKWAATSHFGINGSKGNCFKLRRTDIWSFDEIDDFKIKLNGGLDWRHFFGL